MVHNHHEMIELNPLVIEHHLVKAPRDAPADEFLDCVWYEMTDKIQYLPGGLMKGKISYKGCFHDLPAGLQTHIYAPLGLDIREKWTIGGTLPGEPAQPRELGVNLPTQGLYLREDGDMRCNMLMSGFVRKNLDNSHKVLVERILKKAERIEAHLKVAETVQMPQSPGIQSGSYLSTSSFLRTSSPSSQSNSTTPSQHAERPASYRQDPQISQHPAFRKEDELSQQERSLPALPPYQASSHQEHYAGDIAKQRQSSSEPGSKQFVAELPGSNPNDAQQQQSFQSPGLNGVDHRASTISELSGSDNPHSPGPSSHRSSVPPENPPGQYKYNPQDFVKAGYGQQYSR